jgi:uncharacterized protein (TIGR03118 family)
MKMKICTVLAFVLLSATAVAASGKAPPPRTGFHVVPLVSDQAGVAPNTDPNLVNPWGISQAPGQPLWISDNGTDLSTLYDPNTGAINALVVNIPSGGPTGTVYAPTALGFPISENGLKGNSEFMFATESGALLGWNFNVDQNNAVVAVDNSAKGSAYKGLAIDLGDKLLFAADFVNNEVQAYDNKWNLVRTFTDTSLPKHFAPFNVAWLNGKLYVSFAKRKHGSIDEVDRKGFGYVDVFDINGNLLQHLVANGNLNAPWGMVIAPSGFGQFASALLVGNFGNGKINAYDATTGAFMGSLKDTTGAKIAIDGLWALFPGPNSNTIMFSAGPDDEQHGLLGQITSQ